MTRMTDEQLQRDVIEELRWDARVRPTDIGVEVNSGVVTLTGTAETWGMRLAAQEAAHRVPEVLDVANEIEVKLPGGARRTDTEVALAVRRALTWNMLVPHERIQTTVSQGRVTLEGKVPYLTQFDEAALCVRNVNGVREVRNLITVDHGHAPPSQETLESAIEEALERHAARAARHVHVTVIDGQVMLTGQVTSKPERQAVEGAVRGTKGVRHVTNQIRIS